MTTGRGISFNASLDISDVLSDFRRIEREAAQTARKVANVGRGVGGAAGRGLGGAGRTVAAGAGLGAGLAVFEQVFEKIFELFEDTPVLTQFTDALDLVFKAFGPVVGVLLESLTPVIKALTPAIEPLARALIPLVEIFGTNLLIAVTLLTPLITFAAKGIAFLTKGLQTFINQGITFVIDQLNKIPFVDIQFELATTGNSFDRMATQIEAAGDESETAEPKVKMLADGVMEAGEAADEVALAAREAARTQASYADSQRIVDETTANADARLEAYAKRLEISRMATDDAAQSVALMNRAVEENAAAASMATIVVDELSGGFGAALPPIMAMTFEQQQAAVAARLLGEHTNDMARQIEEAQAAAQLNEDAFAALSPEMQAAAAELGLFGQRVTEVGDAAAAAADVAAAAAAAADVAAAAAAAAAAARPQGSGSAGAVVAGSALGLLMDAGGIFDAAATFVPDDIREQIRDAQAGVDAGMAGSLTEALGGNAPEEFDPEAQRGAYVRGTRRGRRLIVGENFTDEVIRPLGEAPESGGTIIVNVLVGEEPVEAIVETNNQRNNLTGQ